MRIYHNIPALNAYNNLASTNAQLGKSIAKLSSGLRINGAADDAAGLAISEKMRGQILGLDMATRNAQDGISMVQTAEGALSETQSIIQRMRELAVQAANDTLTQQDRAYIQIEINQLRDEVSRIANTTQFNKRKLLDGSGAALWSSDTLEMKAYVRGALRQIDQFNQKSSADGNYKIVVKAIPGQGEVKKSDIFKIKHKNVVSNLSMDDRAISDLYIDNLPAGNYSINSRTANDILLTAGTKVLSGTMINNGAAFSAGTKFAPGTIFSAGTTISASATPPPTVIIAAGSFFGAVGTAVYQIADGTVFKYGTATYATTATNSGGMRISAIAAILSIEFSAAYNTSMVLANNYPLTGNFRIATATATVPQPNITFTTVAAIATAIGSTNYKMTLGASVIIPAIPATTLWTAVNFVQPTAQVNQVFGLNIFGTSFGLGISLTGANSEFSGTANVLLEVTNVDPNSKTVTFKAVAHVLDSNGVSRPYVSDEIQIKEGDTATGKWTAFGVGGSLFSLASGAIAGAGYSVGDKMTLGLMSLSANNNGTRIDISGTQNSSWGGKWGTAASLPDISFVVNATAIQSKEVHFRMFYLNTQNGMLYESDLAMSFKSNYSVTTAYPPLYTTIASFNATYIGQVGANDTRLYDLDKYWDANGNFLLKDPQTLTISQGDGKSTTVTFYSTDTLETIRQKLNNAIANGLDQAKYAIDDTNRFVSYVTENDLTPNTSQSVGGTFVIRSMIAGDGGKLSFAGNEEVIKALSLNVITVAKENQFNVSVLDAHNGATIASNVSITGNLLIGIVHPNIDVEIDPMADIQVTWDDKNKKFNLKENSAEYSAILHLVDNSTIFQVGANQGEDMAIDMGNMSTQALGLHKIVVTDRESATRALGILDNAMGLVSAQRAKLGAFQNRLEYTVSSLTRTSENLTAAESRIRDLDMAKEMMQFTKLNILSQSGTSMLAQANQLPQAVLQLLQGR